MIRGDRPVRTEAEIEITPQMIEAGLAVLSRWSGSIDYCTLGEQEQREFLKEVLCAALRVNGAVKPVSPWGSQSQIAVSTSSIVSWGLSSMKPDHSNIAGLPSDHARLVKALEPFALMSSEGIVKSKTGYVTVTSCAEYFHRAAEAIAALSRAPEAVAWQYRVMFDEGSKRENEWCDWQLTVQSHFDALNVQIADGRKRVQTRPLYATPLALIEVARDLAKTYRTTGSFSTGMEYVRPIMSRLITALSEQGEAGQPAAEGWREISEENGYPPMDTDVILGWWRTWPKPVWEMDLAHYGSERGRWTHGQATHWLPISILPASPAIASQAEEPKHADDCPWDKTRLTLQRRCTCGIASQAEEGSE